MTVKNNKSNQVPQHHNIITEEDKEHWDLWGTPQEDRHHQPVAEGDKRQGDKRQGGIRPLLGTAEGDKPQQVEVGNPQVAVEDMH